MIKILEIVNVGSLKGFKRQTTSTYIMINMKNTNECEKRAQIV